MMFEFLKEYWCITHSPNQNNGTGTTRSMFAPPKACDTRFQTTGAVAGYLIRENERNAENKSDAQAQYVSREQSTAGVL